MYILFLLLIILLILIRITKENFICNVPFRTSNKCFVDKFEQCYNTIDNKIYCQNLANIECTVPPTISSKFLGKVQCL